MNEQGFIFPITLVVSVIVSAFLMHHIQLYSVEKSFFHEVEQVQLLDNMIKYGIDKLENEMKDGNWNPNGLLTLPNGFVSYVIVDKGTFFELKINANTNEGRSNTVTIHFKKTS